jgi:hypothetical protein
MYPQVCGRELARRVGARSSSFELYEEDVMEIEIGLAGIISIGRG